MSDKDDIEKAIEFQIESTERLGVSCTTTKDGHTFLFRKDHLQKLLDKYPENDHIIIFVQRSGGGSNLKG